MRELLESVPIEATRRAGSIRRPAGLSREGARTVLRRLPIIIVSGALLIARLLDRRPLPLLPGLPGHPGHRRRLRRDPLRPGRPRGGLRARPRDRRRRRDAARDVHRAQRRAACPSSGWSSTTRRPCRCPCPAAPWPSARAPSAPGRPGCRSPPAVTSGSIRWSSGPAIPFGLFEASATVGTGTAVTVYPRVEPLPALAAAGQHPGGLELDARAHDADDAAASPRVRPYAPGDAYNRIHWKSTARQGELQVKEFDLEQTADLWIILDLDRHVAGRRRRRVDARVRGPGRRQPGGACAAREPGRGHDHRRASGSRRCRPIAAAARARRSCRSWRRSAPTARVRWSRPSWPPCRASGGA